MSNYLSNRIISRPRYSALYIRPHFSVLNPIIRLSINAQTQLHVIRTIIPTSSRKSSSWFTSLVTVIHSFNSEHKCVSIKYTLMKCCLILTAQALFIFASPKRHLLYNSCSPNDFKTRINTIQHHLIIPVLQYRQGWMYCS